MTWRTFMAFMPAAQRSGIIRQLLRAKIVAKQKNRSRMTEDTKVVDKKGKVVRKGRQYETVDFDWDKQVPKNQLMEAFAKMGYVPSAEEIKKQKGTQDQTD